MTQQPTFSHDEMIVGFADLSGFLAAVSGREDLEVAAALQRHYEQQGAIVQAHGGRVVKQMGDAVLFCFPGGMHVAALTCAREMAEAVEVGIARDLGAVQMRLGVGLACGRVVAGDFGPRGSKTFDVLGDVVNVAALLVRGGAITVSEAMRDALGHAAVLEPQEPVRRAGRVIPGYRAG